MRLTRAALALTVALAVVPRVSEANTSITFPPGSLIIPATSTFQTDCGAVSMYGLAYDVLRANNWLASHGFRKITIYYAVSDTKQSPNRCRPANISVAPAPSGDPSWDDGCDFQITNSPGGTPVKVIDNANTSASNDTTITTINTNGNNEVFPQYPATILGSTATTVGYGGGPLLIASNDAPTFLNLLNGTVTALDAGNNPIDFTPFRTNPGTCTFGVTHYTNIHRAQVQFVASITKDFVSTPPHLALLDTDVTAKTKVVKSSAGSPVAITTATEAGFTATITTSSNHGLAVGDAVLISNVNKAGYNGKFVVTSIPTSKIFTVTLPTNGLPNGTGGTSVLGGDILPNYLNNAGLTFANAQGCPTGGQNSADPTICPLGGSAGQIYDSFDFNDLVNGLLTINDAGQRRYAMLWAPHWETTAGSATGPNVNETTALTNLKNFLQDTTHPSGFFAECAAISSLEGTYESGSPKVKEGLQIQTCKNNGSGGCQVGAIPFGDDRKNASMPPNGTPLFNCTDLTTLTGVGKHCAYYGYPADSFSQVGDYKISPHSGTTPNFTPSATSSAIYKPGVLPLISAIANNDKTKLTTPATARAIIVGDITSRNIMDNTPGEANVLYLGGHDLTDSVPGTKLVLETLLQLGESSVVPPTTTSDAARSSPIFATVTATPVIVQGTFDNVQPAPDMTSCVTIGLCASAGFPSWIFPFTTGHVRATVDASIGLGAQAIGTQVCPGGSCLFDSALTIPTVNVAGCTTPFNGSCRTVFTTTAAPNASGLALRPPNVFVSTPNAATVGPLFGVAPVDYSNIISHVLQGYPNGIGGFKAALGGIDRSTPAVIGASPQVPGTRAQMTYVGATDGMLHAICTAVDAAHGCATLGSELWAFMPRTQAIWVPTNKGRIDGSPKVLDAFGDFTGTGVKAFKTILLFTTGSGDPNNAASALPAAYALDVSNPQTPRVVWEYTLPTTHGAAFDFGVGLTSAVGPVNVAGVTKNLMFVQTNNGGTTTSAGANPGTVVTAIDIETGVAKWTFTYKYPAPRIAADGLPPTTGIPGGVVGVDKTGTGLISNVVFGDLYGNVWELDAATGISSFPGKVLFSYSTDFHPIGSPPTIYSNGSKQFAIVVPGGYADDSDNGSNIASSTQWSNGGGVQKVVSIALDAVPADVPLNESSPAIDIPFTLSLGSAAEKGFAQVKVIGNQVVITTDDGDVNQSNFGTGNTGHVYIKDIGGTLPTTIINGLGGGAATIASDQTTLYSSSGNKQQQLATSAASTTGNRVNTMAAAGHIVRNLWLRTE